jgi:hypothetical protein
MLEYVVAGKGNYLHENVCKGNYLDENACKGNYLHVNVCNTKGGLKP